MRALYALVVPVLLASSGFVTAGYIDDNTTFSLAISVLRGAVGPHARALRIEADVNGIEIHAQDAHNRSHINGWRYGTVTYMGVPLRRLTGPEPIDPALINPDIEANLFDLDSIDFAAAPKLIHDSIAREFAGSSGRHEDGDRATQFHLAPADQRGGAMDRACRQRPRAGRYFCRCARRYRWR